MLKINKNRMNNRKVTIPLNISLMMTGAICVIRISGSCEFSILFGSCEFSPFGNVRNNGTKISDNNSSR